MHRGAILDLEVKAWLGSSDFGSQNPALGGIQVKIIDWELCYSDFLVEMECTRYTGCATVEYAAPRILINHT